MQFNYFRAYQDDDEGNENRLNFWFNLDNWTLNEASLITLDINPDGVETMNSGEWSNIETFSGRFHVEYVPDAEGFPIPVGVGEDGIELYMTQKESNMLNVLQEMFKDTQRIIGRYQVAKPFEWIDLAIEKKLTLPWLEWAIDKGYYEIKSNEKESIKIEKTLLNTERETLLVIIAALAKEAKVDIRKISKAGELIASMTQQLGSSIGATTIERHLKKINQVLENRTK